MYDRMDKLNKMAAPHKVQVPGKTAVSFTVSRSCLHKEPPVESS